MKKPTSDFFKIIDMCAMKKQSNKWINKKMTPGQCANLIYKHCHGNDRIMLLVDSDPNNYGIDTAKEIRKTLLNQEVFDDQDKEYFFTIGKVFVG